jgi:outer membrane protein assembly factor BamB
VSAANPVPTMGKVKRLAVAAVLLAAVGGAAVFIVADYRGHDVEGSPTVEFAPRDSPTPTVRALQWPMYGYDGRRARSLAGVSFRPPFRRLWTFHGRALLEFPPAVAGGRVYLPTFDGRFYALDARTGRALWRFDSGRCSWASPALADGLVLETFLSTEPDCRGERLHVGGELVAFAGRTGAIRWRRSLPPTESSPLVVGQKVVVGDWSGRVSTFAVATGRPVWSQQLGGRIKASVTAAGTRLYVGAYDGRLYALDAGTGRVAWRSSGRRRLFASGAFYSTPTVAYGRVYVGSTDGGVYSFGAASGKLRWLHRTGGYVYSSPAVWRRLVFIGSYDRSFYALDAATGRVRWRFRANGPISGSATVLGGIVWFSTLRERTYALAADTGRVLWTFPDGKYSPVVTDGKRLYLVGYGRLYAFTGR